MKKVISVGLILTLCLLCACAKQPAASEPAESAVVGGWTIAAEETANIPEEALAAFNQAMEGLTGAGHTPIAYLGSQVVAGVNYAYLCRTTLVTATPVTKLTIVTVYRDLEGNASIRDITDVNIADYHSDAEVQFEPAAAAGGWTVNTEYPAKLPENVQKAFDKAFDGMTGIGYQPIAYLGSQVVAGRNYAVLCSATAVTVPPVDALAVAILYEDLQGNVQIRSISGFSIAE